MQQTTVKAGFLPLYLELYEELTPGDYRNYAAFIEGIKSNVEDCGITTVSPGVVFNAEHKEKARKLFADEAVSFIITLHLCYSPSLLVADFLQDLGLPILSIDTTPTASFENMAPDYLTRNHGIHGVMDLTSVLKSRGVDYYVVSGHADDPVFRDRLTKKVQSIGAAVAFRNQKIGLTGEPFVGMGDFSVDFDGLRSRYGIDVKKIPPAALMERGRSISDGEIADVVAEDAAFWDISAVPPEAHREAARSYLALRSILDEEGCTGYTMNFQYITEGMATPFYACSRVMSQGYGYGGEGDVLTASLGYPLNRISRAAKFDEFFCADWKNNRILMSHMGESDSRFVKKDSKPTLTVRDGFVNPRDSVIFRFRAEPGEVTFINLNPTGDKFRLVSGLLDIVDAPPLDEIQAPHYQVATRMPIGRFLERYADCGGGHHLYIAYGNIQEELAVFSRILGFDHHIVAEET